MIIVAQQLSRRGFVSPWIGVGHDMHGRRHRSGPPLRALCHLHPIVSSLLHYCGDKLTYRPRQ